MKTDCPHETIKKVSCCGSTTEKTVPWCQKLDRPRNSRVCEQCGQEGGWTGKVAHIAEGYAEMGLDVFTPAVLPRKARRAFVKKRLHACGQCAHRTYLKIQQYNRWIRENGGYARFIRDIGRLDTWPDLPDCKDAANGEMFCRRCKCLLAAKAHAKNETCPVGNPAWAIIEQE